MCTWAHKYKSEPVSSALSIAILGKMLRKISDCTKLSLLQNTEHNDKAPS